MQEVQVCPEQLGHLKYQEILVVVVVVQVAQLTEIMLLVQQVAHQLHKVLAQVACLSMVVPVETV
jgi:hypothetical protein